VCMPSTVFIGYDKTRNEATFLSQNMDAKGTDGKATKPLAKARPVVRCPPESLVGLGILSRCGV